MKIITKEKIVYINLNSDLKIKLTKIKIKNFIFKIYI